MSYFEQNIPKLKKSYCAFLDVLGFSELILESSVSDVAEEEFFQNYYAVAKKQLEELSTVAKDSSDFVHMKVFTDNIVLAIPWFSEEGESELGYIIDAIKQYQLSMALNGYFVRGGISIGKLFIDDLTIFGPALLDSYHLESKVANDPKVIISGEFLGVIRGHTHYYANPESCPQNGDIIIDSDGNGFINYLDETIIQGDEWYVDWAVLEQHKIKITEAIEKHKGNAKVWYKYHWLCTYHNYFCSQVSHYAGYSDEYLVPDSVLQRRLERVVEINL
ncbi:hypothetical protein [Aliivibrio fischeri]|uniref:hypothetical protein n=1 Tax=Aliivibrio fischeri TaxID=668 RepID=UPI0007C50F16|nr:hypothetical protein [Aliivibrio fischeri]